MISIADVALARYRLSDYLSPTPVEEAAILGSQTWLKLENTNKTHSFKVRGALNAMLSLDDAARARGIVAASSGNHAQGVAYAARLLNVQARIVMPIHTPKRKLEGVKRNGGMAILHGEVYHAAEEEARRLERDEGLTFISPYNDARVIAGAGTVGLEILDVLPNVERVIVPIGGGGLISGVALAVKALRPSVEVIGVNVMAGPAMYNFLYGTQYPDLHHTLAEALPGEIEHNSMTYALTKAYVDRVVLVNEDEIANAIRLLMREYGWAIEGGGAVGVAALMSGAIPQSDQVTAVVVSGGNIDVEALVRILTTD